MEASGYPGTAQSQDDKSAYRQMWLNSFGVELDEEKMWPDAGLRQLAKRLLNV